MQEHEPLETAGDPQATAAEKKIQRKRNKVRSAWIAFVGRILAQLIGAAATILLGLMVVDRYRSLEAKDQSAQVAPAVQAAVRPSSGIPALAVLPVVDFSGGAVQPHFADGLTEALVARLAEARSVRVLSRTTSMAQKGGTRSLPAIAKELGADWIVESSIVRSGHRTRLTAQLIDARTDEHVFARIYDSRTEDLLALQTELARAAARDITAALGKPGLRLAVLPAGID